MKKIIKDVKQKGEESNRIKFPLCRPLAENVIKSIESRLRSLDSETRRRIAVDLHEKPDRLSIELMLKMAENESDWETRVLLLQTLVTVFNEKRTIPIIIKRLEEFQKDVYSINCNELRYLVGFAKILRDKRFILPLGEILSERFLSLSEKGREIIEIVQPVFLELYDDFEIKPRMRNAEASSDKSPLTKTP